MDFVGADGSMNRLQQPNYLHHSVEMMKNNILTELPQEAMMVFDGGKARPFSDEELGQIGALRVESEFCGHLATGSMQGYGIHEDHMTLMFRRK